MIKVKNGNETFEIPSSWLDVRFKQYIKLQGVTDEKKILSILCGMSEEMISQLGNKTLSKLSNILSFIKNKPNFAEFEPPEKLVLDNGVEIKLIQDIREKSFGQKIVLHHILKENQEDLISIFPEAILVYAQPQITGEDFDINKTDEFICFFDKVFLVDLYSSAMHYVTQLKEMLEAEKNALQSAPNAEQVQAGVHMFTQFGDMNTIKALAGGGADWGLRVGEVEKMEYNIAFMVMFMNKTQHEFDENYRKILKNKK